MKFFLLSSALFSLTRHSSVSSYVDTHIKQIRKLNQDVMDFEGIPELNDKFAVGNSTEKEQIQKSNYEVN